MIYGWPRSDGFPRESSLGPDAPSRVAFFNLRPEISELGGFRRRSHALPALDPGTQPGIQAAPSVIIRGRRPHRLNALHSNMRGDEPMRQCIELGEVRFQDHGERPSTDLRAARLAVVAFTGRRGGYRR